MPPTQSTSAVAGFSFSRYLAGHIVRADNFSASAKQHECLLTGMPRLRTDGRHYLLAAAGVPPGQHHVRAAPGHGQRGGAADADASLEVGGDAERVPHKRHVCGRSGPARYVSSCSAATKARANSGCRWLRSLRT